MGKEVTVKDGYTNVWLYPDGIFNGGDEAVLTDAEYTALGDHQALVTLGDTVADPDRTVVVDVDAAVDALTDALNNHLNDGVAAHAASAISYTPTGTIAATTVQAAVAEVANEAEPAA